MRIFVGELPKEITSEQLRALFTPFGSVTESRIANVDGYSKGYGFVSISNDADAERAIAGMNSHTLNGNTLTVRAAKKQDAVNLKG